jgi:hypothetical protein
LPFVAQLQASPGTDDIDQKAIYSNRNSNRDCRA